MAQPFRLIYRMTTYLIPYRKIKDFKFGMITTPTLLDVAAILGLHPHGDTLRPFYYLLYLTRSFQAGIEKHPAPDQTRNRLRRKKQAHSKSITKLRIAPLHAGSMPSEAGRSIGSTRKFFCR